MRLFKMMRVIAICAY